MKTKNGLVLRPLGKEHILMPEGLEAEGFDAMISMNESAAFLWKTVEGKDFDSDQLTSLLMQEYGITREVAEHDVADMLRGWKEMRIVED
jgi:hypothetical protein